MKELEVKKVKGIHDIFLAAYLRMLGFPVTSFRSSSSFSLEVCFEPSAELDQAISDYFAKKDKTNALVFTESYRTLRAMLQAAKSPRSEGGGR
jgi:hypothetical protein